MFILPTPPGEKLLWRRRLGRVVTGEEVVVQVETFTTRPQLNEVLRVLTLVGTELIQHERREYATERTIIQAIRDDLQTVLRPEAEVAL